MPRDSKQVNVRVSPEVYEVLDSAAFVRGFRGMQELLGPLIEAEATRLAREEPVQDALAARRRQAESGCRR